MAKPKVLVIVGPTASGKSNMAVKLAKKFNGEIISADSRQVYKGLNIGTGKITRLEMKGIPHYLLDVADPKMQFSVSQYKELALNSLRYIVTKNKLPIVVGGTGLYIDTLMGRINFPDVAPNPLLRKKLAKKSTSELFKILKKKDPRRAKMIDLNNKVRLIRALEIIAAIGAVPTQLGHGVSKLGWEYIYIGLKPDDLDKKIRLRIHKWLKNGLIKEVKRLHESGANWKRFDKIGLIYHSVAKYLQGKISKKEMTEEMFKEIRRYAKRQMTWFKRNKKIKWFRPEEYKQIERYVRIALLGSPRAKLRGD